MKESRYITKIAPFPRTTASSSGLFRYHQPTRNLVAAIAVALGLSGAAHASQTGMSVNATTSAATPDQAGNLPLPKIATHAPPGFRLYRPGYRMVDKAVLVSVQICRLPGWAAAGPQRLRVDLRDSTGRSVDIGERVLPRLGLQTGNNCISTAVRLAAIPSYGEIINICAVTSRRTNCGQP